jgi:prevent-host-death family protein
MKVTATNAKVQFGRILSEANVTPVVIQKSGRDVAVLLSIAEYERMSVIEDQYWARQAQEAYEEGFLGGDESEKLLSDLLHAQD